mgnify:FL=1
MKEQAVLIIQQSLPIFFILVLLFVFYVICTMVLEQTALLDNLFFFLVLFIILPDLLRIFEVVAQTVSILTSTLYSFIPVISSILFLLQGIIAIFAWNPFILIIVQLILFLTEHIFISAIVIALFLDIWTRGIPAIPLSKMAQFIRSFLLISIGVLMMVLTAVMTISGTLILTLNQSISSPLKRILEQSIPIVGSIIVQALSVMKKTQIVSSSAVGAGAILTFVAVMGTPLFFLLIKAILYRILSVISEPLMPSSITNLIEDISKNLLVLCGVVAIVLCSLIVIIIIILSLSYFVIGSG